MTQSLVPPPLAAVPAEPAAGKHAYAVAGAIEPMRLVQADIPGGGFSALVPPGPREIEAAKAASVGKEPQLLHYGLAPLQWDCPDGGMVQVWRYFRQVYAKLGGEAFVWWHWDEETGRYFAVVPAFYHVSAGGLRYEQATQFCRTCRVATVPNADQCPHCGPDATLSRLRVRGTTHSHGSMSPFHSATDHENELVATGFHHTFGYVERAPLFAMSFVVADAKHRFRPDPFLLTACRDDGFFARLERWLTLVDRSSAVGNSFAILDGDAELTRVGSTGAAHVALRSFRRASAPRMERCAPIDAVRHDEGVDRESSPVRAPREPSTQASTLAEELRQRLTDNEAREKERDAAKTEAAALPSSRRGRALRLLRGRRVTRLDAPFGIDYAGSDTDDTPQLTPDGGLRLPRREDVAVFEELADAMLQSRGQFRGDKRVWAHVAWCTVSTWFLLDHDGFVEENGEEIVGSPSRAALRAAGLAADGAMSESWAAKFAAYAELKKTHLYLETCAASDFLDPDSYLDQARTHVGLWLLCGVARLLVSDDLIDRKAAEEFIEAANEEAAPLVDPNPSELGVQG